MVRITAIRLEDGNSHEHISRVKWVNPESNETGENSRAEMVEFIENNNQVIVGQGNNSVQVGVVNTNPKHIRTHADGNWTNNLLALPTF